MKEIFAIPAVGAIIVKKIENKDFILVQTREKNTTDGTNGLLEIPAGKIREYEYFLKHCEERYGKRPDYKLQRFKVRMKATI